MNLTVKKTFTFVAVLITTAALLCAKPEKKAKTSKVSKEKVVIVGTEGAYPPYNFVRDDGIADGYDMDVIKALDEKIPGVTFKFQPTAWDGIFVALESGKFDIIASQISKNKEREAKYLFSEQPYLYSFGAIAFKKGRTDIKSIEDLHGKTVAAGVGSYFTTWLENYNKEHNNAIKIQYYDGNAAVFFNDIANGRVDATLTDPVTTDLFVKESNLALDYVIRTDEPPAPAYILFANTKKGRENKALIDKAFEEIVADGTLSKISEKWFGQDFTKAAAGSK